MYIPVAQMPDKVTELNSRIAPLWWIVRTQVEPHTLTAAVTHDSRSDGRNARGAHPQHGRDRRADNLTRTLQHAAVHHFRHLGTTDGGDRHLWSMAYSVQQRTLELGVRMALGAPASNIRNMVIRQGMLLAGIGLAIGIGGALWLTKFLTGFLFGVKTWDPTAFVLTPIFLCAVALVAVWVPARKATRIDLISALRFE